MRHRVSFIAGIAVGYVLGTRAGRERYEQLRKAAREFSQNPAVRNTAEAAALSGREAVSKAATTISTKVADVVPESVASRMHFLQPHGSEHANGRRPVGDDRDDWGTNT